MLLFWCIFTTANRHVPLPIYMLPGGGAARPLPGASAAEADLHAGRQAAHQTG